jgi:hypothetical protein
MFVEEMDSAYVLSQGHATVFYNLEIDAFNGIVLVIGLIYVLVSFAGE